MNVDLNQTVVDCQKLVQDLEKEKNDAATVVASLETQLAGKVKEYEDKIVALEAKLLTPENEQKLLDFLGRLKALITHTT